LEGPKQKEVEDAFEYLRELRKDPKKFEAWVDRVMEGWLKRREKNSSQHSRTSKRS
jgi:hypothetical protein